MLRGMIIPACRLIRRINVQVFRNALHNTQNILYSILHSYLLSELLLGS